MNNFYEFKPINFNPISLDAIYTSLILAICFTILYFILLKYIYSYKKTKKGVNELITLKNKYFKEIKSLDINKETFFFELNMLLKNYLEDFKILPGIKAMTSQEIAKNSKINKLEEIAKICEKFEYSQEKTTENNNKITLKNNAIKVIENS